MTRFAFIPLAIAASMATLSAGAVLAADVSASTADTSASAPAIDMTGQWQLTVTGPSGTTTPKLELTQKGDALTGSYISQVLGTNPLTGSVKDGSFTITINAMLTVVYTGTAESKDALKGSMTLNGGPGGTFTATRLK